MVELKLAGPLQIYELAPLGDANKFIGLPSQICVLFALALTVGTGFTITFTVAESLHPPKPTTYTVYCVEVGGLANGFATVVEDNPVAGVH
jgi:hypothetical protein